MKDSTLDDIEKNELLKLRQQIINRETWKDKAWYFISNMDFSSENIQPESPTTIKTETINIERLYLWHFISSSWPILITSITFLLFGIFDKNTSFIQVLGVAFILSPIMLGFAWVFAKAFSFIPILFNNPNYNYTLNALLCSLIFIFFGVIGMLSEKRKAVAE